MYAYRVEYQPHPSLRNLFHGQLSLWAADDAVPPDFVGLVPHFQTYTFQFQMRGRSIVAGSAVWTGPSVQDHPDFAWYPYVVMPENPELQYARVRHLMDHSPAVTSALDTSSSVDLRQTNLIAHVPGYGRTEPDRIHGDHLHQPLPVSPHQLLAAIVQRSSSFGLDLRQAQLGRTEYAIGEELELVGDCSQSGYVYVFDINPLGELSLIFPSPGDDNRIRASTHFRIPPRVPARVRGPLGSHRLKAVVTQRPLLLTGFTHPPQRDAATGTWNPRSLRLPPTQLQLVTALLGDTMQNTCGDDIRTATGVAEQLREFSHDEVP